MSDETKINSHEHLTCLHFSAGSHTNSLATVLESVTAWIRDNPDTNVFHVSVQYDLTKGDLEPWWFADVYVQGEDT